MCVDAIESLVAFVARLLSKIYQRRVLCAGSDRSFRKSIYILVAEYGGYFTIEEVEV